MKEYYFLSGMPRSGNTLLGSIINQNPNLNLTANTIVSDIVYQLSLLKGGEIYQNFPDENSLNNVIKNVFNNYYQNWKAKFIIDRGVWGTPGNLEVLKLIIKKPKFIILYRPVLECLASFIKIEKPTNVEKRCEYLMEEYGMIGKSLLSIKNIIKEKEDYIIINYLDLVKNPSNEINKIYKFLNIDKFKHTFNNIDNFSANGIKYDDSILFSSLHTIRTDKIKLNKYKIEDYLPPCIIKKYSNLDI
jgi:sulfotransferase